MIIAIWGCGGTGKTTLATGLGSIYANHGTVGVIDTNLCSPTLPIQLAGTRLEQEHSLGRHLNRLGTNEIRPLFPPASPVQRDVPRGTDGQGHLHRL